MFILMILGVFTGRRADPVCGARRGDGGEGACSALVSRESALVANNILLAVVGVCCLYRDNLAAWSRNCCWAGR